MPHQLTKNADKALCEIYRVYLTRSKSGENKYNAKDFSDIERWENAIFEGWETEDALDSLIELARAHMIDLDISNGFTLKTDAIIYMENRFKNGLSDVLDFLGQVKGLIPFV